MNSLRDEVKDAIADALKDKNPGKSTSSIFEAAADIADAVFKVLQVPEVDQDRLYEVRLKEPWLRCGGEKVYAYVYWSTEDVIERRNYFEMPPWVNEEAEDFLKENEEAIRDAMVTAGWDVIDTLMRDRR